MGIELTFAYNKLCGEIPSEIFTINNMTILNLSGNELSGPILENVGQAKSLVELRLRCNALMGNIPQSLSSLQFFRDFSVEENMMSGTVPAEVVAMPYFYDFGLEQSEGYSLDYPQMVEDFNEKAIFKSFYDKLPDHVKEYCPWDGEEPLSETYFAVLDGQGHIVSLSMYGSAYRDSGIDESFVIPDELTKLVHLK